MGITMVITFTHSNMHFDNNACSSRAGLSTYNHKVLCRRVHRRYVHSASRSHNKHNCVGGVGVAYTTLHNKATVHITHQINEDSLYIIVCMYYFMYYFM